MLVIEKGAYFHEDDFELHEPNAFANLYEYGGFFSTYEGAVNVLAGSVFGGGTTVNWSASLKVQETLFFAQCSINEFYILFFCSFNTLFAKNGPSKA